MVPRLETFGDALDASPQLTFFNARGGPVGEGRFNVGGMPVSNAFAGGGGSSLVYDTVNADEVSFAVAGGMGETDIGGPVLNIVPRSGGNTVAGQAFINGAGEWSKGDNLNDELRAVGITETPGVIKSYDASVSLGGPIVRDRLWFFGSYRKLNTEEALEGVVANANAFDLSRWDWALDPSVIPRRSRGRTAYVGRTTAQVAGNHRISVNCDHQSRCEWSPLKVETDGCHSRGANWVAAGQTGGFGSFSPEADTEYRELPYTVAQARWTAPDYNLSILTANGECAALTGNNLNFGGLSGNVTEVSPETLRGWGVREYDWQWAVILQHEVLPRMSVDVAYSVDRSAASPSPTTRCATPRSTISGRSTRRAIPGSRAAEGIRSASTCPRPRRRPSLRRTTSRSRPTSAPGGPTTGTAWTYPSTRACARDSRCRSARIPAAKSRTRARRC